MTYRGRQLPLSPGLLLIFLVVCLASCSGSTDAEKFRYTHVSTVAQLEEPFGIAINGGKLYSSDGSSGTVNEIDASGSTRIIASGLNTPSAIAFFSNGDLAVADTGSHTIRKIAVDGTTSILAGMDGTSGSRDGPALSATFNAPIGLAIAEDGAIYISDTYNDRIRVIRDGMVSTLAGSTRGFSDGPGHEAKFDTPLGIAMLGDNLLVADSGNARIRMMRQGGDVFTLSGSDAHDLIDGLLSAASFVRPTAITVDSLGRIFVADGNAIRLIGGRVLQSVETIAGDRRGNVDGESPSARFSRPSGLVIGDDGKLFVADSENGSVRLINDGARDSVSKAPGAQRPEVQLPLATRWPFDPASNPREIAGTLGEIRGDLKPAGKSVWFHNGLDIAGAYGEKATFIRDETVLDPHSAENIGTARELLRLPLIGYIHLRLGRDKDDRLFGDPRFQFERDAGGKLVDLRIPRGAKFLAGDAIGTLNAMNHVHLIAGRNGHEINALAALELPGIKDSIAPVIEEVRLFDTAWNEIDQKSPLPAQIRIVIRAYDRMDGNSERRRLGVYRVGYQLMSNGNSLGEIEWRINFNRSPSNDAVDLAYAMGSRSGYTPDTIFNYIATNRIDGDDAREDFLDMSQLAPGKYTLRVFVADYFGNTATKDVEVMK